MIVSKEGKMGHTWLGEGEEIIDSWQVYIGDPTPNSAKITGKLFVTNKNVHFNAGISLEENAAAKMEPRIFQKLKPFQKSDDNLTMPYSEIRGAEIVKKSFILKMLQITLKSGDNLEFQFGAMSPKKALKAILSRI
jgi:hypothetical protein